MERLIICGGGHVSLALAQIGALLEFDVVVIDDREEFANSERFPMAEALAMPFADALDALGSREDDYYAIVTRGHTFDRECLVHILKGKYAYVGMIGSRGKVAIAMDYLQNEGFAQAVLDQVHAPIGLKIGGQTPAEVAVSIAAELVQVRAASGPAAAPVPHGEPGVLCTITRKTGSAPRGVGAWMLVRPDGSTDGTIGGGAVEFQAVKDALALLADGVPLIRKTYDLTPNAAELGMVCGGKIDVEFTIRKQGEA
ncbi:conserved hypothetical protein [uncultured Eubacteriales bacterium]|uniref:Xanthine dehydrogenase n=1 Tax=uncultured Eubacteriales bacterium TaxID=172733 RepID=A0A212KLS3_9FIRM|nr:conserved hypothetical protein [uncultured Eubacteriales bacterium]